MMLHPAHDPEDPVLLAWVARSRQEDLTLRQVTSASLMAVAPLGLLEGGATVGSGGPYIHVRASVREPFDTGSRITDLGVPYIPGAVCRVAGPRCTRDDRCAHGSVLPSLQLHFHAALPATR